MQIGKDMAVRIDYRLTGEAGQVLDSSEGREPLAYLHGNNNIIPGLEKALTGKAAGDAVKVTVAPADAYGVRDEGLVGQIPIAAFGDGQRPEAGMQFQAQTNMGPRLLTVLEVQGETVTVDGNHPLAGMALSFDVTVVEVRPATAEELAHGHVHGAGGHDHG